MISPAQLDDLMHRGWPGLVTICVDGWLVRLAAGVTARANSVLPRQYPRDLDAALQEVETLYREQGLAPTFQISPAAQPGTLDDLLAGRGYELRSPTLVLTTAAVRVLQSSAPLQAEVAISNEPGEDWMDCWWSVDGRGGREARAIARQILLSGPALYVSVFDSARVVAVGRLALVDTWGGVYCMAVTEENQRRGYGTALLRSLVDAGVESDIRNVWLQVVEANRPARTLYERAGFTIASRYHYRSLPH